MNNHSEDYLDKLLNSVNGEELEPQNDEMEEDFLSTLLEEAKNSETVSLEEAKIMTEPMVTRRVSKSEADFLMEFEKELEEDNLAGFDDFVRNFDNEDLIAGEGMNPFDAFSMGNMLDEMDIPVGDSMVEEPAMEEAVYEEPAHEESIYEETVPETPMMEALAMEDLFFDEPNEEPVASEDTDSFSLGGVDLGALLNETSEDDVSEDTPSEEPASVDDMFANLFGDDVIADGDNESQGMSLDGGSEGIDLSNLGEADLMSLLAGDGDLSDIGDMLSQGEDSEVPMDGVDAFAMFAEGEMSAQSSDEADKPAKKEKKGGFFGKISAILSGLMGDDEDEEEAVSLKTNGAPSADQLSGENADILASFDASEEKPSKKEKKKKKEKKEKKPKEKKEKKPKEKKEKKPKEKKEKKPKQVDNTPPLPRGPVLMIWVMAISLVALVMMGVNISGYSASVSNAKSYYNNGDYSEAYGELLGLEIKEADMMLYNQVATLAAVDSEIKNYEIFSSYERHVDALDSLICAAGRCEVNADNAEVYECVGQMQILKAKVTNLLHNNYGITYEEAIEMYNIKDRDDYTIALYEKLKELGLSE